MNATGTAVVIGVSCGVVAGLMVAELTAFTPLLAKRIVRRAAMIFYSHDQRAAAERAEEWEAVIDARPGNVLKLGTALVWGGGAAKLIALRTVQRIRRSGRVRAEVALRATRAQWRVWAPAWLFCGTSFGAVFLNVGKPGRGSLAAIQALVIGVVIMVLGMSVTPPASRAIRKRFERVRRR
jgi:hypothetical protein